MGLFSRSVFFIYLILNLTYGTLKGHLFEEILPHGDEVVSGYLGCHTDSADNRILPFQQTVPPRTEPDFIYPMARCLTACKRKGFLYAGAEEYTNNCFCGNNKPSTKKISLGECHQAPYRLKTFEIEQEPSYLGCYQDGGSSDRLFQGLHTNFKNDLTQEKCNEHCLVSGFAYSGTQLSIECFCSNTKPEDGKKSLESECNMTCSGDQSKTCGGINRLTVFLAGIPLEEGVRSTSGASYLGCYRDGGPDNRLMGDLQTNFYSHLTSEKCIAHCLVLGFPYAGTQYSVECFCSKSKPPSGKKTPESDCSMECSGDKTKTCGGSDRLSVYATGSPVPTGVEDEEIISSYLGCFKESACVHLPNIVRFHGANTVELCILFCKYTGSKYAGVVFGGNCLCGNNKPTRKLLANEAECSSNCGGNNQQKCGGDWRTGIYETKVSLNNGPLLRPLGCFKDSKDRLLGGYQQSFPWSLTSQTCVSLCHRKRFNYAGTGNGKDCFCGDTKPSFKDYVSDGECSTRCTGNNKETCGGDQRVEIFDTGLTDSPPDTNDGKYIGCYVDQENPRILSGHFEDFGLYLTNLKCTGLCYSKGFLYSGTENSRDCFCGDVPPGPNLRAQEGDCYKPCFGNPTTKCGGNWRISIRETGIPDLPTTGKYVGCFYDQNNNILQDLRITTFEKTNSPRRCINFCAQLGFRYSGVESGKECFCGNDEPRSDLGVNDNECHFPCSGDQRETCGGDKRLAVYIANNTNKDFPVLPLNHKVDDFCTTSETVVDGKRSCRGNVIFDEQFTTPLGDRWSHVVKIPDSPDFEFALFDSNPENSFTKQGKLVIKPTVLNNTFVQSGSLYLERCTGTSGTRECGYDAASYNILPPVATARIHTRDSFSFRYGIVEIRAKLPLGDWLVPELWLEPKNHYYGPSYESGRIRIAMNRGNLNLNCDGEDYGSKRLESGVAMGPPDNVQRQSIVTKLPTNWHNRFHNYTLIWAPGSISFKIDNEQAEKLVPTGRRLCEVVGFDRECLTWSSGSNIAPFDQDFYISLGLSVGNAWDFPNDCNNRGKHKPWRNSEIKAMLKFWQDKHNWQATWTEDKSALYIDRVRVTAL